MRTIVLLLLVLLAGLGYMARQQSITIQDQQRQIATEQEAMKAASLTLQDKCAEQARKVFASLGFGANDMAEYTNHYNAKLNKCMVHLQHQLFAGQAMFKFMNVFDAFENKDVGKYIWRTTGDKKYWEVSPDQCNVVSPSGDNQACHSEEEFNKLASAYMNG